MTRLNTRQMKLDSDTDSENDVVRRKRMCGHKKQYDSDMEALAWGREANDRYNQSKEWDTYYCPYCRHWHLTSIGD